MVNIAPFEPLRRMINYDPFSPSMSQVLREMMGDLEQMWTEPPWGGLRAREDIRLDIQENDANYLIRAEVPGYAKGDVHVDLDGKQVTIRAEKATREEKKGNGERTIRSECAQTSLFRIFRLPTDVSEEGASAKCENGILEMTLPKKNGSHVKHLSVL